MTVEDLLKVIKNPLDNPSTLRALASKLKRDVNEDDLALASKQEKNNDQARQNFYLSLFNHFFNTVIFLPQDKVQELKEKGIITKEYDTLKSILMGNYNLKTYDNLLDTIRKIRKYDASLLDLFYQNEYNYFKRIKSDFISGTFTTNVEFKHSLFINISQSSLHSFCNVLIDELTRENLPFDIIFQDEDLKRQDKVIINAPTKLLPRYYEILEKIKAAHPEFVFNPSPFLTGDINGWIGYGSIPSEKIPTDSYDYDEEQSFYEIRAKCVNEALDKVEVWLINNLDSLININNKKVKIKDFLASALSRKKAKELGIDVESDMDKVAKFQAIYKIFLINYQSRKKKKQKDKIDNIIFTFNHNDIYYCFQMLALIPDFQQVLKSIYETSCENHGISKNNTSFDVFALSELDKSKAEEIPVFIAGNKMFVSKSLKSIYNLHPVVKLYENYIPISTEEYYYLNSRGVVVPIYSIGFTNPNLKVEYSDPYYYLVDYAVASIGLRSDINPSGEVLRLTEEEANIINRYYDLTITPRMESSNIKKY